MKFSFFKSKSSQKEKKKCQEKRKTMGEQSTRHTRMTHSPSHSISSASTQSSLHTLHQQETRGIFRTLEPVWSYLPDHHDQWIPLAADAQRVLEIALNNQQTSCTISLDRPQAPPTITKVYFSSPPAATLPSSAPASPLPSTSASTTTKRRRPVTQFFTSSSMHQHNNKSSPNLTVRPRHDKQSLPPLPSRLDGLYFNHNLRRALVPYWWFEQDNEQGGKGMCKFDYKNQVRLEALSDGRTTLTLTDTSFSVPFQIILEAADRSSREECRGFMYLNTPPVVQPPPVSKPLSGNPLVIYDDQHQSDPDDSLYHHDDIFLNRRCSI
ncbi:uncharacterized protein BX664DRAFT_332724 [Halteromyces radiatus]|uniref:uncharacterized protein n=1 Tax=Halteromyces radiatus TaxID=101107 RepID=UPI002220B99A|nr:uncharacterized protein BX664DRAFT_332724 [Halteromyces radiatus]KAI8089319.1 hypothetical protein BX664DRAFT_332724 [Halteromyces radiatus]